MPKYNSLVRGNIVLVVVQSDTGNARFGIELEELGSKPLPVGVVSDEIKNACADRDK